jgi:hypothetical protein
MLHYKKMKIRRVSDLTVENDLIPGRWATSWQRFYRNKLLLIFYRVNYRLFFFFMECFCYVHMNYFKSVHMNIYYIMYHDVNDWKIVNRYIL